MSHGKLREEKDCLNCGHTVEEHFCPHCGQENTETRQPFHFLFTHFVEDFTHYDGQFWKTMKYLLFRPGRLTKEYSAGKRQQYVAPVKLYIFISFLTFFIPTLFPSDNSEKKKETPDLFITSKEEKAKEDSTAVVAMKNLEKKGYLSPEITTKVTNRIIKKDSIDEDDEFFDTDKRGALIIAGTTNIKQYDSLVAKENSFLLKSGRPFANKYFELIEQGLNKKEIQQKFLETFIHMIPKALFIYLPLFAFFLWVFHNKKRWWYFDHGIFTLHYFSFLLISILILRILDQFKDSIDIGFVNAICGFANAVIIIYSLTYFFIAHHRVYESRKRVTIITGMSLFIVNAIGILILLIGLFITSFLLIH